MNEELIDVTEDDEVYDTVQGAYYDDKLSVCWKVMALGVFLGIVSLFIVCWGQLTHLEYDKTTEGIVEGNKLVYSINGNEFTKDDVEYRNGTECTVLLQYGGKVLSVMPTDSFDEIQTTNNNIMMRCCGYSFTVFAFTFIACIFMFMKDRNNRIYSSMGIN